MEDWLHLSGPLLCTQLGAPWCDTQLWQRLAAAAPDPARPPPAAAGGAAASPSCGVRGTLPIGRESWGDDLYRALQARNRRDMRLYAAARGRARSLLERAGVVVPPDVGPALEWGMASGDCARLDWGGGWLAAAVGAWRGQDDGGDEEEYSADLAFGQGGGGRAGETGGGSKTGVKIGGAPAHLPVWMSCDLALSRVTNASFQTTFGRRPLAGPAEGRGRMAGTVFAEGGDVVRKTESYSQHDEEWYAYHTFFYQQTRGTFMELGAVGCVCLCLVCMCVCVCI